MTNESRPWAAEFDGLVWDDEFDMPVFTLVDAAPIEEPEEPSTDSGGYFVTYRNGYPEKLSPAEAVEYARVVEERRMADPDFSPVADLESVAGALAVSASPDLQLAVDVKEMAELESRMNPPGPWRDASRRVARDVGLVIDRLLGKPQPRRRPSFRTPRTRRRAVRARARSPGRPSDPDEPGPPLGRRHSARVV